TGVLRRHPDRVRTAAEAARGRRQARRVGGAVAHPVRRDAHLRWGGGRGRRDLAARGRHRLQPQPPAAARALPPGGRCRRQAGRVRRRAAAQAVAARTRGPGPDAPALDLTRPAGPDPLDRPAPRTPRRAGAGSAYPRGVSRVIDEILQRGADGGRITPEEALLIYTDAPLHPLGEAADAVRRRRYPDGIVTYLIDRNINYTNVCVTACKFCAFYRPPKHAEGW